ncbi:MAG TPA: DUF2934 domain-containing protein [Bryobacteraceae bacterium]|jgi:hypothetical protein|nr:DUF2934 domain-containing protein [Bryobacteraceae bacterium]
MASKAKDSNSRESEQPGAEAQKQDRFLDSMREEKIRRRAYEIYLARGEESGNDLEDWLQAEHELMTDQSEAAGE